METVPVFCFCSGILGGGGFVSWSWDWTSQQGQVLGILFVVVPHRRQGDFNLAPFSESRAVWLWEVGFDKGGDYLRTAGR